MDFYIDDYKDLIVDDDYTLAINHAIELASKVCGRVIFKENKLYRSGTIYLKSNIELHFESNSKLKALDDINRFNVNNQIIKEGLETNTFNNCDYNGKPYLYFIYGFGINNIKFSGNGIIDGNEEIFYGEINEDYIEGKFYPRMPLIFIENSKNLEFKDVTLTHSAFWTLHLVGSSNILIDSINIINNRRMLNADGIDPDHSNNIIIRNSNIESADDCIVFKGTKENIKYGDCYDITIENCNLKSSSAAIKIGTETYCNFYNINVNNVNISDSNRGISFQLRDKGNIYDIKFDNLNIETHMFNPKPFWGKAECISITNVKRNIDSENGIINNIEFNNIKAKSEHGIFIYGNDNINDIRFNDTVINLVDNTKYNKRVYDLRPNIGNIVFEDDVKELYLHSCTNIKFNK